MYRFVRAVTEFCVCEHHFSEDQFDTTCRGKNRRKLVLGAMPNINLEGIDEGKDIGIVKLEPTDTEEKTEKTVEKVEKEEKHCVKGPGSKGAVNKRRKLEKMSTYSCDDCDFSSSFSLILKEHIKSKHTLSFDQCEYVDILPSKLKRHKESKYKGITDRCENVATELSAQEGAKFPCNLCKYVATKLSNLKQHILSKHVGIHYPCDQCDHSASDPSNLNRHKQSKHQVCIMNFVLSIQNSTNF